MIDATAECAVIFSLSPGQAGDAPEGRWLLTELGAASEPCAMIMDKASEGDETRKLVSELGFFPVVPPKSSRTEPWEYDKELYIAFKLCISCGPIPPEGGFLCLIN
jgi:hypothetical protein